MPNTMTISNNNLETFTLIYLNPLETNSNGNEEQSLREIIHQYHRFNDEQICLQFIQSSVKINRLILITTLTTVINSIVQLPQIVAIYILNNETSKAEDLNSSKIKMIQGDWKTLLNRLRIDQNERENYQIEDLLSYSCYHSIKTNENFIFNQNNVQYQQFQKFIQCLTSNENFHSNDRIDLIRLCQEFYQSNPYVLSQIEEFRTNYTSERSLSWYTRRSFLYRLLNKALRYERNFDLLLLLRFFIVDLIQILNKKRIVSSTDTSCRLYRTQLFSKNDFDVWMKSVGEKICIQTFLWTCSVQPASLLSSSDDVESVLLEIDMENMSWETDESNKNEVILMIGSVFRLNSIICDAQGLWHIHLVHLPEKLKTNKDSLALGFILEEMGQWQCAQQFFQRYLTQLSKGHEDISRCYHASGEIYLKQGQYENSTKSFKKSLEIDSTHGKENDSSSAMSYHSLGIVHMKKGDYVVALKSLKKAMEIWKKSLDNDHLNLAMCYNNIGIVHEVQKKYSEALEFYQRTWSIRQQRLSFDDPLLAQSHACLGNVHYNLNHFDMALEHFRFAFEIWKRSDFTPFTHLALTLRNIGLTCQAQGDVAQSVYYLKESATLYRQGGSSNQLELAQIERLLRRLATK